MFWRFGFHNPSAIDSLLDKEDVSLDELFEDDDLLQEAKTHNQKLINFLCEPVILKQLVHLITADDLPDHQSLKYPYLASEILSCEIPALVDAIVLDHLDLLSKSWSIFDTDATLGTLQTGYFCKVNAVLLSKRTSEMIAFIQSRDNIIDKMINHLDDASPVGDLLLTLVRCEELPEGQGIVQWLSDQQLLNKLIDRLEPNRDPETHANAQQLISDIIRMSQTSNPESPTIGTNALIVELKSKEIMTRLADYMLDGSAPNATSSLINGVTIIIDFIRHNNSDFEIDQMLVMGAMEQSLLPSVDLGEMLLVMADRTDQFQKLLVQPRSVSEPVPTTSGPQVPLGFERLKICELYAELLHCSNMSNLNLPVKENITISEITQQRSTMSTPLGDTHTLEFLDQHHVNRELGMRDEDTATSVNETLTSGDISNELGNTTSPLSKETEFTEESVNEAKHDDIVEEDAMVAEESKNTSKPDEAAVDEEEVHELRQEAKQTDVTEADDKDVAAEAEPNMPMPLMAEFGGEQVPVGDYLKMQYVKHRVLPACLDLFFEFQWNNFLHYVVYDTLHQICNGRMDIGYNRELVISVFRDGQLTQRITEAQKLNDESCVKSKGRRLGYMGHLTFISDEVIKVLASYPDEIYNAVKESLDMESWDSYINGPLRETKLRDRVPLGGIKPAGGLDSLEHDMITEDITRQIAGVQGDTDFDKEQEYISGEFQHDPSYEQDESRLDQDFSVDSDEEADEAAFGEEWKEFRRAFPSENNEGGKFETEKASNTWAMRQPQNPFDEEDEIADEEDPFATQASDPFGGDTDDFGGFVSAGNENETGNKKAAEDPFGQFEQEAEKEVSWSNFASDFGEFEKLKVTNVESPNVEFLTPTTESEFHIEDTGERHDQAEPSTRSSEPSTRSSEGQESAQ
ncbi:hypothetical protein INT43_005345 [Umbelopsis isabellina]|uniref:SAPS-domain-containing protein n=1 Tax=Mortierella isabellina TaxID=91625 RepID=A0A8H7PL88_MORIS|nr:hypothetical protein INT43_005345 [Umbelopsis isabellina]